MKKEKFGVEGEGKEQKQYPFARDLQIYMNQYDQDMPEDPTDDTGLDLESDGLGEHETSN